MKTLKLLHVKNRTGSSSGNTSESSVYNTFPTTKQYVYSLVSLSKINELKNLGLTEEKVKIYWSTKIKPLECNKRNS